MKILLHKNFEKRYKKLRLGEKRRFKKQRDLFLENPYHPLLHNHPLQGPYRGYRSIGISGDLRAIYKIIDPDTVYFVALGTHNELYS